MTKSISLDTFRPQTGENANQFSTSFPIVNTSGNCAVNIFMLAFVAGEMDN